MPATHLTPLLCIPATDGERRFRHSGWANRRVKVAHALKRTDPRLINFHRFICCGSDCAVEYSPSTQNYRLRASYCKNRHCEPCQTAKARTIARNLRERLERKADGRYRFVTLTLRADGKPLIERIKRLYSSFKKLRRSKLWSGSQKGGAAMLEVKLGTSDPEGGSVQWHAHLHVITEGGWLNQNALSNEWLRATGDSHIVDVRAIQDGRGAAAYVTKYVTKGTSPAVWNDIDLATEWIVASKGVRTCATFGTWRGFKLLKKTASAEDWVYVGHLQTLIDRSRAGDDECAKLLIHLRRPIDHEFDYITAQ